jgi:hypothetical protein
MAPGADEGLGQILRSLPREQPPAVSLDAILDRWRRQRRAKLLGGAFVVAAGLLALLFVPNSSREVPVHLQIRVIEAPEEAETEEVSEAFVLASAPEELQTP